LPLPKGDLRIAQRFNAGSGGPTAPVPKGRMNSSNIMRHFILPFFVLETQPSLRDSMPLFGNPTLERVGYSQISLRETANDSAFLFA